MIDIFHTFCDGPNAKAKFLTVYIAEAHAKDEWWLSTAPKASEGESACINRHKVIADRIAAAKRFVKEFNFPIELVCDSMLGSAQDFFQAWPERLYIIREGVIVYQGGLGPFDYRLAEVKDWLTKNC